jgi:Spy/CpxP family protein refolding chaperone
MKSIRNVLFGTLVAGGAVLATVGGLSTASAQETTPAATTNTGYPGGHFHHGHGGFWREYSHLGLTDDQKASMKSIFTAAKPQLQALHKQAQANHLKLAQTKPDDPNYPTVVAEVAQAEATLASQRSTQHSQLRAQLYAVLTPAQKTQLATQQAAWAAKAAARQSAE